MRRLLNTLYVLTEGTFLSLDGENVVARLEGSEVGRIPLHSLEAIKTFSRSGATPALMGACAERGIALSFFGHSGRFLCDVHGATRGNVLLRKRQCLVSDEPSVSLAVARNFVIDKQGKIAYLSVGYDEKEFAELIDTVAAQLKK